MQDDRFEHWSRELVFNGQRYLAEMLRVLVYKTAPSLFEKLDYENDDCFLEPLLFAFFTNPKRETYQLEQLMYGLFAPELRPACANLRLDTSGRLFIPGLGELQITTNTHEIELRFDYATNDFKCVASGQVWPVRWARCSRVADTGMEIFRHPHTLLDRFLFDNNGNSVNSEAPQNVANKTAHLSAAFELIATYCPDIAADIAKVTRRVLLYRSLAPNSFATLSAHGAVFLNVPCDADEVFFVEDLAHQCAHVLFNAITIEKERFLAVDPATPLADLAGDPDEPRHVYSAFHGLFTYTIICHVLATLRERSVFHGRQAHELLGRLGFTLRKFATDLRQLDKRHLFTDEGQRCYQRFASRYAHHMAQEGELFKRFDFSNQPYNFSYEHFTARNPAPDILRPSNMEAVAQ